MIHIFPNVYEYVREDTARMQLYPLHVKPDVEELKANFEQPNYTPAPPQELVNKYRHLDSPFYTVDYAELADGSWRILEAGDGSVSGLSEGQDYGQFFRAVYQCFREG